MMNQLSRIERLIRLGGVTASDIGRQAMRDPSFVHQLRNGRQMRPETEARIAAWLDAAERQARNDACTR